MHAGAVVALALSPDRPVAQKAGAAGEMPAGQRKPVRVTLVMKMTDFGAQPGQSEPSNRLAPASDTEPTQQSRQTPSDQPTLEPTPAEPLTATEPKPIEPEPIKPDVTEPLPLDEHLAQTPPQDAPPTPLRTDPTAPTPATETTASTAPSPADPTQTTADPAQPPDPAALAKQTGQLLSHAVPVLAEFVQAQAVEQQAAATEPFEPAEPVEPAELTEPDTPTEPVKAAESTIAQNVPDTSDPAESTVIAQNTPRQTDPAEKNQTAEVYNEDSVDRRLEFVRKGRLKVPSNIARQKITGTVKFLVTVDTDGTVLEVQVIDDAGEPRMLAAARAALEKSTFTPGLLDGQPVRSKRLIEYQF